MAPDQHVVRPWVVTSVFPRLPCRSRWAFRTGVLALGVLLAVFAFLHWQPPLIGISALGLPLLFGVYLKETDAFEDMSVSSLAAVAFLAAAIGTGWSFTLNAIWSVTYDDVLGTPMTPPEQLINLVLIPIGGVVLMLIPAVAVRIWRPDVREALDGYAIGAVSALFFTAAGTITQQASQFSNGLVAKDFPSDALFATAVVRGVAAPLTAVAIGGLIGATLWFKRRTDPTPARRRYIVTSPVFAITVAALTYIGQNGIDYMWIPYAEIVGLYAAITVVALLVLRIVLHSTVLGEAAPDTTPDQPVLCPQCTHVVPDRAYCVNCGVAAGAASRSSRKARRANRPVPAGSAPEGP
ncbi:PrsW family glutamic-type intramembrane protease [Mycolicibacterium komossense]|uniref:PrsW family intramembrane metalloprotease n=1 Tax=Mycolicibacterium komossense TaxID=1779 RepID=A0ABT3C5U6_9MYCO|nr:PrsW family glutamic-type intramembrane protease [Mycolicibacterium komossense]MCV7224847.1 PrsW family intramembrane metalloprotease [Mycolicibacterium komossense]